jgi:hypothetical protein
MYLIAILLANHRDRRLARAKALEPHRARNLGQPLGNLAVDLGGGNRHFEPTLQTARGG